MSRIASSTLLWLRRAVTLAGLICLVACGFKPLYRHHQDDVIPELAHVKIATIPDRFGQKLRNQLVGLLTPYDHVPRPLYELSVGLKFATRDMAILKDTTTSRSEVTLWTTIALRDLQTGRVIYETTDMSSADFNLLLTSPYGATVSENGAKDRLITEAAQMIRLRLASFFANRLASSSGTT